jgi:hypothetical protein
MDAFRHILQLIAFVFALATTGLLSRVGHLFIERARVKYSGLSAAASLNALLLIYLNWLSFWELRTTPGWTLLSITAIFLFALSVFLTSYFATPHMTTDTKIDMGAFYWRERKPFYWSFCISQVLAVICNQVFSYNGTEVNFIRENAIDLLTLLPIALALAVPKRWAQWAAALALFILNLFFLLALEPVFK